MTTFIFIVNIVIAIFFILLSINQIFVIKRQKFEYKSLKTKISDIVNSQFEIKEKLHINAESILDLITVLKKGHLELEKQFKHIHEGQVITHSGIRVLIKNKNESIDEEINTLQSLIDDIIEHENENDGKTINMYCGTDNLCKIKFNSKEELNEFLDVIKKCTKEENSYEAENSSKNSDVDNQSCSRKKRPSRADNG